MTDFREELKHLSQIDLYSYDLVLMDIRMPSLNGVELYYRLRAMSPDMKVLFLTSLDAVNELASVLPGIAMNNILRKPINHEILLFRVKVSLQSQN